MGKQDNAFALYSKAVDEVNAPKVHNSVRGAAQVLRNLEMRKEN